MHACTGWGWAQESINNYRVTFPNSFSVLSMILPGSLGLTFPNLWTETTQFCNCAMNDKVAWGQRKKNATGFGSVLLEPWLPQIKNGSLLSLFWLLHVPITCCSCYLQNCLGAGAREAGWEMGRGSLSSLSFRSCLSWSGSWNYRISPGGFPACTKAFASGPWAVLRSNQEISEENIQLTSSSVALWILGCVPNLPIAKIFPSTQTAMPHICPGFTVHFSGKKNECVCFLYLTQNPTLWSFLLCARYYIHKIVHTSHVRPRIIFLPAERTFVHMPEPTALQDHPNEGLRCSEVGSSLCRPVSFQLVLPSPEQHFSKTTLRALDSISSLSLACWGCWSHTAS